MRAEIRPGGPIRGTLAAPPSKSMAHRALLCAALAGGTSRVDNLAHSQDIDATLGAAAAAALEALEARVEALEQADVEVTQHPFEADLSTLEGLTAAGVWNIAQARIEF